MTDLHRLSIREITEGLSQAKFSSRELTEHYLKRINKIDAQVQSFVTVTPEQALAQADAADAAIKAGTATVLTGVPIAHKDIFCTQGIKTTAGSKMLDNFISPYDATVVAKGKVAGLVTLGKVNMDEFAMGSTSESSYFGATKNPWALDHVPGGSSGGSAAAVAADLAPFRYPPARTGGSMTAPRRIRTTNADPLNSWKLPIGHDMPRATTEHNRATAAAWLEARRRRTGRRPARHPRRRPCAGIPCCAAGQRRARAPLWPHGCPGPVRRARRDRCSRPR